MNKWFLVLLSIFFVCKLYSNDGMAKKPDLSHMAAKMEFCDCIKKIDSSPIKIVSNYSAITSVSELLDLFKGKPVFIDLWATWCRPCIEAFKFSDSLYKFLEENGIEMIYVSIDKQESDLLWKTRIKEYKLSGYHVLAGKLLRDDFTTLIWGGIDVFSIPRYLIFNKNKILVNNDALHPDSGTALFKEIELALK